MSNWTTISNSSYAWEQEAIEHLRKHLPPESRIYGWSNFEFVTDSGSIYEVDALVIGPYGAFLVEIKSRPGAVSGGGNFWKWTHEGRSFSGDNPLLLANRKAKALISLLGRQKAFNKLQTPFLDVLVFLSHETNEIKLSGNDAFKIANRDGIIKAIRQRDCPGLKQFSTPPISKHQLRAFHKAMEQAGLRQLSSTRKAGDYKLDTLFWDCPTGAYQDWLGTHVTTKSGDRLVRIYAQHRQASQEDKDILQSAAEREHQILSRLDHDGILRVDTMTQADIGPALIYRFDKNARRLDHYLEENKGNLSLDQRLDLLRQITEAVAYAHRKNVVHRALSPQSILVFPREGDSPRVRIKIYNWQVGVLQGESQSSRLTKISRTLHANQLIEDNSTVYLAPELTAKQYFEGPELDIYSLGAIAYRLLSDQSPGENTLEIYTKLKQAGGYLDIRSVLNSVDDSIVELIQYSTNVDRDLRYDAQEFLEGIDKIEDELTAPEEVAVVDPRFARPKEQIAHGFTVKQSLGSGGISKVLLIENADEQTLVLKVASEPEHNKRIKKEFETLQKLSHPGVINAHKLYEFGELTGFTMERAGENTLAQRLRIDGKFGIDFLERFGKQLLKTIDYLDQQGVAHRDIKPENLGVGSMGKSKGQHRLILFDFSLSQSPLDQIHIGTPPYLDPFLENRKTRRWDSYAERYAAAMTLYEMATGGTAQYGDGKSAAHLTDCEANIEQDLFPDNLQHSMGAFFQKALSPDYKKRHDNAEDMLREWTDLFRDVDKPAVAIQTKHTEHEVATTEDLLEDATPETQLILLGLSTRLANALDRIGLVTVKDLLKFPLIRIHRMRGVGKKTREEAAALVHSLRKRFPTNQEAEVEQIREATEDEDASEVEVASIDMIVKKIMALDSKRKATQEQETLRGFLGFTSDANFAPDVWPSQADFARTVDVSRARVGQIVTKARERWLKVPSLNSLREAIANLLLSQNGVMTHQELISSVLHLRGSALEDPERQRMASVVVRAAIEAERGLKQPRFAEARRRNHIFIALDPLYAEYAQKLGEAADNLASMDPLPTAPRAFEELQAIPFPDIGEAQPPSHARLAQLASAASETAAVSPRLEIYPRGLCAERALRLAQNNLFGSKELTVEGIRQRVLSRYPDSEPVPDRPKLDELLATISFRLEWSPAKEAYIAPQRADTLLTSGVSSLARTRTRYEGSGAGGLSSDEAEAQRLQEKLEYGIKSGSFLVLSVDARHIMRAQKELLHRFDLNLLDGDALFLSVMKAMAKELGVNWALVLGADASDKQSRDWERLQMLVQRAVPEIRKTIEQSDKPVLLINAGLFARYEQMHVLDSLRAQSGTATGPKGLWVLIPGGGGSMASLGHAVIPMVNPAQFEKLNEPWLENKVNRKAEVAK